MGRRRAYGEGGRRELREPRASKCRSKETAHRRLVLRDERWFHPVSLSAVPRPLTCTFSSQRVRSYPLVSGTADQFGWSVWWSISRQATVVLEGRLSSQARS